MQNAVAKRLRIHNVVANRIHIYEVMPTSQIIQTNHFNYRHLPNTPFCPFTTSWPTARTHLAMSNLATSLHSAFRIPHSAPISSPRPPSQISSSPPPSAAHSSPPTPPPSPPYPAHPPPPPSSH